MRKIFIALLLFPSLLMAGTVTIRTDSAATKDLPGWVDRVSLRTANSVTYEQDSIGSGKFETRVFTGPIHEYDSAAGQWVRPDFTVIDTVIGDYDHRVRTSPGWAIDYNDDGDFRFITVQGRSASFARQFTTDNIDITGRITRNGWKENVRLLNASAEDSLIWTYTIITDPADSLSKFQVLNWLDNRLLYPTATDANGDSVGVLRINVSGAVTNGRLNGGMIYKVYADSAEFPIDVDPTVQDTAVSANSGGFAASKRDTTTGTTPDPDDYRICTVSDAVYRAFMQFDLSGAGTPSSINSATLYLDFTGGADPNAGQYDTLLVVEGTQSGALAVAQWNDFTGWAASGAYTTIEVLADTVVMADGGIGLKSWTLNAAGKANVLSAMGSGTFALVMLDVEDIKDVVDAGNNGVTRTDDPAYPYLVIDYVAASPPGLTYTNADSIPYRIPFFAQVDSTGGNAITTRGFQYFMMGDNTDTITVTDSVSDLTSVDFVGWSDSLVAVDTSVVVRAWGTNGAGTSYSPWDTISTTATGGGTSIPLNVMGVEGTGSVN